MTAKLYKTMVGAFVVGGIALFTVALVLLGGGKLFSNAVEYVLYFDGSVSGLSIGAPVVFRGRAHGQRNPDQPGGQFTRFQCNHSSYNQD